MDGLLRIVLVFTEDGARFPGFMQSPTLDVVCQQSKMKTGSCLQLFDVGNFSSSSSYPSLKTF